MSNFQITQGTGTIIATDVGGGGENYQKIKLIDATLGSTAPTGVSANPLQISLAFTGANTVPLLIDGSGVVQPVSGTVAATQSGVWNITNVSGTISLPTGASTEATLTAVKLDLDQFTFVASNLLVDGSGVTQPISAVSLPLPTGAATQTTLAGIKTDTDNLDVALSTRASEATVSNIQTQTDKLTFVASNLRVDGSGVTQPVSGTVTSNAGTGNFTVVQSVGTSLHTNVDNFPASQTVNGTVAATQSGTWTVSLSSGSIEIGTVDQGTPNTLANAWPVELTDGTNVLGTSAHPVRVDPTGTTTQPISGSVSVSNFPATQPVSGTVTANQGTSPWVISGTVTVGNASLAVTQSGVWSIGRTWSLSSGSDSVSAVQSGTWNITNISGTVSLPTGASTAAKQPALGTAGTASTDVITVQGIAGMTALKVDGSAVTQPVSGTITANQGTSPWVVSLASTTITGTVAVTQSTSPWVVSGTVTSNAGTGTFNNQQSNITLDYDTSAGTQNLTVWGIALPASGGAVAGGTATNPIRIDPTGTTTQPISGTVTANAGTGNFTVVQPTGTNLHTVLDSGTLTSITNALPAGTNVIGHIITDSGSTTAVTGTVTVAQATGTNLHAVLDSGTLTSITNPVTVAQATPANLQATVTPIAITKGTQGATGFTTQDLKDAGRTFITFTADAIAGVTTEALVTFSLNKAGTVTASQTNYTITNGKTLRIQALSTSLQAGAAAGEWARGKLRINTAGATTTSSPLIITIEAGNVSAATATAGSAILPIPDGLEITGNGTITIGLSHVSSATTNVESFTLVGYEY